MGRRACTVLTVGLLWAPVLWAQVPAGGEFVIATESSSPAVAADAAGNFVVVFHDQRDGDQSGISARRYDASGTTVGAAFRVNSYTTGFQGGNGGQDVAVDSAGNFIVMWMSASEPPSQDGSEGGVYGQRYDASGVARGSEFQVNTFTTGNQMFPAVASDAAGNVVAVWVSFGQGGPGSRIFGQRYDRSGEPDGVEFQVDSQDGVFDTWPQVASDAAGRSVVVWERSGLDQRNFGIFARRYSASGAPSGAEFRVDSSTTLDLPASAAVALDSNGDFVVSWSVVSEWWGCCAVLARRFDAAGVPRGADLIVAPQQSSSWNSSVTMDASGGFIVAWTTYSDLPGNGYVRARRYEATGDPRGDEFQVNELDRNSPRVVGDPNGNFVVVSESTASFVVAQRFGGVVPAPSTVDTAPSSGSDGNGVLEPGESVEVLPSWRNVNGQAQTFDGRALGISGPVAGGVRYDLHDDAASYGTLPNGGTTSCSDCYAIGVVSNGSRPSAHWDAQLTERLTPDSLGQTRTWPLHIGDSFDDVPRTSPFYRSVETMLHRGVTAGCRSRDYCPRDPVTREQMAVFALVGRHGASYLPPACASPLFGDVPVSSPYCRFIEDLSRRGVSSGCGDGNYCPGDAITREQTAVFLLRTLDPALQPRACSPPNMFTDVPEDSPFCRWIEELARRGIASGCGDGRFCPGSATTREQMAVLTAQTFGLTLY